MSSKDFLGKGVNHPDAFLRMNYLLQAAALSKGIVEGSAGAELSRAYVKTMKDVSQKLVIRMSPQIKNISCKICHSILPSPQTVKKKTGKFVSHSCANCGKSKMQAIRKRRKAAPPSA